jgi:hypothetical protein
VGRGRVIDELTAAEAETYREGDWVASHGPRCKLCGCLADNHSTAGPCLICGCPDYEGRKP